MACPPHRLQRLDAVRGLRKQVDRLAAEWEPDLVAGPVAAGLAVAVAEFILDGLYAHNRISKQPTPAGRRYGS